VVILSGFSFIALNEERDYGHKFLLNFVVLDGKFSVLILR
jgi:hypothetical protein